jgi:hypothetical protein
MVILLPKCHAQWGAQGAAWIKGDVAENAGAAMQTRTFERRPGRASISYPLFTRSHGK